MAWTEWLLLMHYATLPQRVMYEKVFQTIDQWSHLLIRVPYLVHSCKYFSYQRWKLEWFSPNKFQVRHSKLGCPSNPKRYQLSNFIRFGNKFIAILHFKLKLLICLKRTQKKLSFFFNSDFLSMLIFLNFPFLNLLVWTKKISLHNWERIDNPVLNVLLEKVLIQWKNTHNFYPKPHPHNLQLWLVLYPEMYCCPLLCYSPLYHHTGNPKIQKRITTWSSKYIAQHFNKNYLHIASFKNLLIASFKNVIS